MLYTQFHTDIAQITLAGTERGLTQLHYQFQKKSACITIPKEWAPNESLFLEAKKQLTAYFEQKLKVFSLQLSPQGTAFQKRVWNALTHIPYGETRSYEDIAIAIENPKGCRAIGMANSKNAIPIIIPCHRVIGKNGKLTGFAHGLEAKQYLLELEGAI